MDDSETPVIAAVRGAVRSLYATQPARTEGGPPVIVVGFSGGCDSTVLLDALAHVAAKIEFKVAALHVHHGLSPNADDWADFCSSECARRDVPMTVHRARVERAPGESLEAAARDARYAAFAAVDADAIALAHHADDQAETVLLQLLRGAGAAGLAAMPALRRDSHPPLLRPLLGLARSTLLSYARSRNLRWIEDESNADTRLRRNFLRHEIAPRLSAAFPGYPATLARSAAHSAEAAELLDELAMLDGASAIATDVGASLTLDRARLQELLRRSPARARNLLRWFLRQHRLPPPSTTRLAAMLDQFDRAGPGARVAIEHSGVEIGIHRGSIVVHARVVGPFEAIWHGEPELSLPHGTLAFVPSSGNGIAAAALRAKQVSIRQREGGERLRLAADRPERPLKKLLQDAGIPPWLRASLPLVYCDGQLAAVPGVGVNAPFQPASGEDGLVLRWRPTTDAAGPC